MSEENKEQEEPKVNRFDLTFKAQPYAEGKWIADTWDESTKQVKPKVFDSEYYTVSIMKGTEPKDVLGLSELRQYNRQLFIEELTGIFGVRLTNSRLEDLNKVLDKYAAI